MMRQLEMVEEIKEHTLVILDSNTRNVKIKDTHSENLIVFETFASHLLLSMGVGQERFEVIRSEFIEEFGAQMEEINFNDLKVFLEKHDIYADILDSDNVENMFKLFKSNLRISYRIKDDLSCKKVFVSPMAKLGKEKKAVKNRWAKYLSNLRIVDTPGDHFTMVNNSNASVLAQLISDIF
jgi:thioesterase domain-containing protein